MGELILVLGGTRSGKSHFAEQLVGRLNSQVIYVATASAGDEEMSQRIAEHRARRPSSWQTVEETHQLAEVIEEYGQRENVILVDCLTMWLTNLMLDKNLSEPEIDLNFIMERVRSVVKAATSSEATVVLVANEVGLGMVPDYPLGRAYRDIAGHVNQYMADAADAVYFVVAGLALEIKSRAINVNW